MRRINLETFKEIYAIRHRSPTDIARKLKIEWDTAYRALQRIKDEKITPRKYANKLNGARRKRTGRRKTIDDKVSAAPVLPPTPKVPESTYLPPVPKPAIPKPLPPARKPLPVYVKPVRTWNPVAMPELSPEELQEEEELKDYTTNFKRGLYAIFAPEKLADSNGSVPYNARETIRELLVRINSARGFELEYHLFNLEFLVNTISKGIKSHGSKRRLVRITGVELSREAEPRAAISDGIPYGLSRFKKLFYGNPFILMDYIFGSDPPIKKLANGLTVQHANRYKGSKIPRYVHLNARLKQAAEEE